MQWPALLPSALSLWWAVQIAQEIQLARRLRQTGIAVAGRIVRQREVNGRGGRYQVATIGFTTRTGQPIEAESQGNTRNLEFLDGDQVRVCYDPAHPNRFLLAQELVSRSRYWWLAITGLMAGAGLLYTCS